MRRDKKTGKKLRNKNCEKQNLENCKINLKKIFEMRNENGTDCRGEKLEKETKMQKRNLCISLPPPPIQVTK